MVETYDNADLWLMQQEQKLARRPKCDVCKEPIQDDFAYVLGGVRYCPSCWEEFVSDEIVVPIDEDEY